VYYRLTPISIATPARAALGSTKPTEAQIRELEKAHKEQFVLLVRVAKLWQEMAKSFAKFPDSDPRKKALIEYGDFFKPRLVRWLKLQYRLEKAGVPKMGLSPTSILMWLDPKQMPKLESLAKQIDQEGKGISGVGFIPLIIWGVIALIGAFTAVEVTDELNTTAEEKEELLSETAKRCKELNLTGDACSKLISQTQAEASSGGFGGLTMIMMLALALLIVPKLIPNKSAAKAAA